MSRARFTPTAEFNPGEQGRRLAFAVALSTLLIVTSLTMGLFPRPATADSIAGLKAQAKEVAQKLVEEQLQIGAYQQQYSVATEKVSTDARMVARIGQQIGQDERRIKKDTLEVRQQAITTYMDADTGLSGSDSLLFTGSVESASLTSEYTSITTGRIDNSVDQLRTDQGTLHTEQTTLQQEQSVDQADQRKQATALGQSVSSERQMESVQAEVTGQLAQAVAAQAAAQSAAAQAAVTAAQKAAVQKAAVQSGVAKATVSVATATAVSVSDPVLNPFLQCVVQAESGGNYQDVSPNGLYMGAFQFSQPTWNMAAVDAGLPMLAGVHPNVASKAEQDTVAVALYALDGEQPWLGDRCS